LGGEGKSDPRGGKANSKQKSTLGMEGVKTSLVRGKVVGLKEKKSPLGIEKD